MSTYTPLSREQLAQRIAMDFPDGTYVNLGIGMPTTLARWLPRDREIILHSENGILGMGPAGEVEDVDLINASKEQVSLVPGAAICDHVVSFTMMRGGHIDLTVLGAYQVSAGGDLANWDTGAPDAIPAVGGAMDLAVGARAVWVMMEHTTKKREPKIVERCALPLTAAAVVDRIYTDLARIDVTPQGLLVRAMVPGLDADTLQQLTAAPLRFDERVAVFSV
ncbi:MAG TPA: 3-oxoacid CoA-transferase subunit B [Burkholderiaceae bacterium]|nr:3-oxoacid CoA-transferase subunit B [Burkholderiaceae bacterium]